MDPKESNEAESYSWFQKFPAGKILRVTEGLVVRLLRRHRSRVVKSSVKDSSPIPGETRFLRSVRNEQIRMALSERIPRSLKDSNRDQYPTIFPESSRFIMDHPKNRVKQRGFWERLLTWKKE